jgi:hypothetical protein
MTNNGRFAHGEEENAPMKMTAEQEKPKHVFDDGDIVTAEVVSIKSEEKKSQRTGKPYTRFNWVFAIQAPDEEYDGQYVYGDTFATFSTRDDCDLRNWSQAIMNVEMPAGFELETDDLIGMQCRLLLGAREYKDAKDRDKIANFVQDVFPSDAEATYGEEPF